MTPMERFHASLDYAKSKHPAFVKSRFHGLCVLLEEVGEVVWAIIRGDRENLLEEISHVQVVCYRWLEWEEERHNRAILSAGRPELCKQCVRLLSGCGYILPHDGYCPGHESRTVKDSNGREDGR